METVVAFKAYDGKIFRTSRECSTYEKSVSYSHMVFLNKSIVRIMSIICIGMNSEK